MNSIFWLQVVLLNLQISKMDFMKRAIGIIAVSIIRETNWILIVIGGIIFAISPYFEYNRTRKFKKP